MKRGPYQTWADETVVKQEENEENGKREREWGLSTSVNEGTVLIELGCGDNSEISIMDDRQKHLVEG